MAETVAEVLAVARLGDDVDRHLVDVAADHARVDGGRAGLVGAADDVVDSALLGARLAHADGARHVGVVVVIPGAVVHDDEVALLDHVGARLGVRVGAVGPGGDDRTKGELVGAVGEHVVLQLHADLLLGEAGADEAADVVEGLVGDLLGAAHELNLLGVLNAAQVADVAVEARGQAGDADGRAGGVEGVEEREGAGVLDGHHAGTGLEGALGCPAGGVDDVLIDLPGAVGAQALAEGVVVARVRVEPQSGRGHHGGVGYLEVESALGTGEPAQVGVVAQDDGVIAALRHELAQALDASRARSVVCHVSSFRLGWV